MGKDRGKDESSDLLRKLGNLLEKQKKELLRSNLGRVEQLSQQAETLIEQIKRTRQTNDQKEKKQILELYRRLILMASAHRRNVTKQLRQVGDGKKIIGAYGDNI